MLAPGRGIGNKEATDGSSRDSMPEPKFEEIYITMYYNVYSIRREKYSKLKKPQLFVPWNEI